MGFVSLTLIWIYFFVPPAAAELSDLFANTERPLHCDKLSGHSPKNFSKKSALWEKTFVWEQTQNYTYIENPVETLNVAFVSVPKASVEVYTLANCDPSVIAKFKDGN